MKSISKSIVDFVTGKMTYDNFGLVLNLNPEIWDEIQNLLTQEIIDDPTNTFWTTKNRSILEANNFLVQSAALAFGYNELGKLRTHNLISDLVEYNFPDIKRKSPPSESADTILEKIGMDYLGGDEIDDLVNYMVYAIEANTIKERNQLLKKNLREVFHIAPRRIPKWAQDPEWPMGENSPMAFISQKRDGDLVRYEFQDVDTGETRIVEQFY